MTPVSRLPKILISQDEIKQAVAKLAAEIRRDYQGKQPLIIGILKGSFVFMADLVRELDLPVEVDFVRLSSYGAGTETSGRVKVLHGLKTSIKGRDVLVVEDIVDTGLTVSFLMDYLQKKKPSSLRLCTLTDKPSRHQVPVTIDYLGFTVPNKFIVGYGIDWNEKFRHLRDICSID
ncbi:MAG: hypoxanthine phosphoribosyltransferase [Dehalococcoidia bacterium]|nr:hypoxanthine phosphoribosyltransferase [Dehalococcoidia bacterium]